MRTHFLGVIAFMAMLVLLALWLDAPGSAMGNLWYPKPDSKSSSQQMESLHTCDNSQANYIGPLVPDQATPKPNIFLSDLEPVDAIPSEVWSKRSGFSVSSATAPEYWAQMLGSGWYLDWNMRAGMQLSGLEHWQMVRVHEDCISPSPDAIQAIASRNRNQVWIIGNEPDVIWQDNVTPARYAVAYHDLYQLIKSADPYSQIAVGGISQATPLRLRYLDQVLQTYQKLYHEHLPADWWTVHGYVLREEKGSWGVDIPPGIAATQGQLYEVSDHGRLDLFEGQISAFRHWMKENGYQDTPLALTEFGILMPISYGFSLETIAGYLEQTFTWLYQAADETSGYPDDAYRLVQKWAWFSISDLTYSASDLGDISSGKLTTVGERFRSVVSTKGQ